MVKSIFLALIFCFLLKVNAIAQNVGFKIYYAPGMYTQDLQNLLKKNNTFSAYRLMVGAHIDPKNSGGVNKEVFIKNIKKFYPQPESVGVLCIDLENRLYENLVSPKNVEDFKEAKNAFLWMIKTVRDNRPNVKVGFYGLPLREYYKKKQYNQSVDFSLDSVLVRCDYIFPSLYTMYPDSQNGRSRNEDYLSDNLDTALSYGKKLNKPVVPFVWNLVHPGNKLYGGQLLSKDEVMKNIMFMKNYEYNKVHIAGIVWWDPDHIWFSKVLKTNLKIDSREEPKSVQSKLLKEYLDSFIEQK